jgi:hypothetical protein
LEDRSAAGIRNNARDAVSLSLSTGSWRRGRRTTQGRNPPSSALRLNASLLCQPWQVHEFNTHIVPWRKDDGWCIDSARFTLFLSFFRNLPALDRTDMFSGSEVSVLLYLRRPKLFRKTAIPHLTHQRPKEQLLFTEKFKITYLSKIIFTNSFFTPKIKTCN